MKHFTNKFYVILCILIVGFSFRGNANVIYVNQAVTQGGDGTSWLNAYKSLQSALEVAKSGDQIWVARGTYKPSSTNGLGTVARLKHFRMIDGVAMYGGFAGTETSTSQRTAFGQGETNETILSGDIDNDGTLTNNCYHVIYNPGSLTNAAILDGFTITGGNANDMTGGHAWGGGMGNYSNASPTIRNVVFIANYGNNGGGLFNYIKSSPTLNNVSFIGNSSKHGGGMYNWNNSCPVLTNVKFISNTSLGEGGAISTFSNSALAITNGLIVSNSAVRGGGIDCQSSSPLALTNVTIAANTATGDAGGVCCNSSATFNNCILWGNTSQKLFPDMDIFSGNTVTMNYSCYSTKLYDIGNGGTFTTTNHNVTTNPVFADAEHGDFRIKKVSPCVNAGYDNYNSLTTDIRGTGYGRKIGTTDMGAYEYNSTVDTDVDVTIKYVNANLTTGNNDGTTWDNAYKLLQTALENAQPGDQIWVATGTYKPSSAYDLPNPTHVIDPTIDPTRYYHFRMKADVAIYGGFAGNEARSYDLSLRDFTTNETILSGDIGTEKDYSDNCCHVIYNPESSALTGTAVLDGFTVTGGYANGNYPHHYGAGMYNDNCSPTISNVIFFDNKTSIESGSGGGMCNEKSSPRLINVAFTSNKSVTGGGMSNISSSPTLVNVSFTQNGAEYAGGGLYSEHGSVDLTNCTFIKNETYLDCGIGSYGGGMYHNSDLLATLNNVTFNLNKSYKGGGLSFRGKSTVLNNCIIWGNVSSVSGDDICLSKGVATLNHSCYSNSNNDLYTEEGASFAFDGNCITSDPQFIDVSTGDCRINDNSPCIDKGNNIYNSTLTDIRGQSRIQNTTIDIGAYEWTDGLDFICTNPTSGGEITSDQHICKGDTPIAFSSQSLPAGYKGTLEYQWQSSTTSSTEGFSDIASANAETYAPGKLSVTTWYKRLARVTCMDSWTDAAESNVVCVEVVLVSNPIITEGSNIYTYDGTAKTVVINVAEGETVEWTDFGSMETPSTEFSKTDAGTYPATAQIKNITYGCLSSNFASVYLIINKADVTVTPNASQSKIYGNDDPTITYTYTPELIAGNTFSGALTRNTGNNVGNYNITMGTLSAGNNYKITLAEANFEVTPKPITVTPDTKTKVYGEADPSLSYTFAPSLLGTDAITGALSRMEGENVGSYDITIGTLTAGVNYEIAVADVNFTITPKSISVIANPSQEKTYGDADPALTYTVTPDLNKGDSFTGELSRTSGENIGSYAIEIGSLTAGSNYSIGFTTADFAIAPRQLAISHPILTTAKQHDGTTNAKVTAGTLTGVVASDEGKISVIAQANYNDASIGTGKTITVTYTLSGSAADNYLKPSDYIVNNGVICDKTTIEKLQSPESGCEGELMNISYTILTGEPTEYQILFNNTAIAAGFANIDYAAIPASIGSGTIAFNIPEGVSHGTYTANLQLRNSIGAESEQYAFTFTINLSSDYLIGKFSDVVLCDNSSNLFATYQWYKNDAAINGATKQYYCDPNGLSGAYHVQVTTTNGESLKTCPATFNKKITKNTGINVYPNPAKLGQQLTIEISGITEEEFDGATLQIYNMQGVEVYKSGNVESINHLTINNQSGNYVIRITTAKGKTLNGKIALTN